MNELVFELEQQTPLLHFQYDMAGATLRASLVKPLLDRFIWDAVCAEMESPEVAFEKYCHLLKGYSVKKKGEFNKSFFREEMPYRSLDYKMSITTSNIKITEFQGSYFSYFGNMGEDNSHKYFSYTSDKIFLKFQFYGQEIGGIINKYVALFFSSTNFGTRATKGFGSFIIKNRFNPIYTYSYFKSLMLIGDNEPYKILFKNIDLFYKSLRGGINSYGKGREHLFYMKPLIWQYFKKKYRVNWEKRKIKEEYYPHVQSKHKETYENQQGFHNTPVGYTSESFWAIKDLMGLSSSESWKYPYNINITKEALDEYGEEIQRASSPLIFKPVKNKDSYNVYLIIKSSSPYESVAGGSIIIQPPANKEPIRLKVPEHFDLQEMFDYFLKDDFNIRDYILFNNNENTAKILEKIYEDIKTNR